jgi:hypothetical protein
MTVLPLRTNRVTMDIYPVARFELDVVSLLFRSERRPPPSADRNDAIVLMQEHHLVQACPRVRGETATLSGSGYAANEGKAVHGSARIHRW